MKVAVIGLDCATPQLVFDRFLAELPNLSRLMTGRDLGAARELTTRRSPCPPGPP